MNFKFGMFVFEILITI